MIHWVPQDPEVLNDLVDATIASVVKYDEKHGTALLESLRVYLERDRSLKSAAAALNIHKHTLAYRLKRVQEITGRQLSCSGDFVELWMALQAYEIARSLSWATTS
jgi:purine catabolism regulator